MSEPLTIEDVGPIHKLSIPIPEEGGIVVLRGPNATGKTTAINAASAVAGKSAAKKALTPRDGKKTGRVAYQSVKLNVGRSVRQTGELEVSAIVGGLDVASVVDPGYSDPVVADKHRLRAILSIAADTESQKGFAKQLGSMASGVELQMTDGDLSECNDLLELTESVRRKAQAAAREIEAEIQSLRANVQAIRANHPDDVDGEPATTDKILAAQADVLKASEAYGLAVTAEQTGKAKHEAAFQASLELAKKRSERTTIPTVEQATAAFDEARAAVERLAKDLEHAKTIYHVRENELAQAESLERFFKEMQATIEAAGGGDPLDLARAVDRAREAFEQAQEKAERLKRSLEADKARQQANALERQANSLNWRASALRVLASTGIDDLIGSAAKELIHGLEIEDGRLMFRSKNRGLVPFAELSSGERWTVALEMAARAVPRGFVPIHQEAWEGLDFDNRRLVAGIARQTGAVILTAEASHESKPDLTAEIFEEGGE